MSQNRGRREPAAQLPAVRAGAWIAVLALGVSGLGWSACARRPEPKKIVAYDACRPGFVWREAEPEDHVCVLPEVRQQAADDNRQADARRNSSGGDYGADTCSAGYVWREAFTNDHVCVSTETREEVQLDNSKARGRRAPPLPPE